MNKPKFAQGKHYDTNIKGRWLVFNPNESYVEMRTQPGEFSPFITEIENGSAVYCFGYYGIDQKHRWLCVSYMGMVGYIPQYYCKR